MKQKNKMQVIINEKSHRFAQRSIDMLADIICELVDVLNEAEDSETDSGIGLDVLKIVRRYSEKYDIARKDL